MKQILGLFQTRASASSLHTAPSPTSSATHSRPSLFRKDFSPLHSHETLTTSPTVTTNVVNARQTWRLDTLVKIISMFWLEPFAFESSKNYQVRQLILLKQFNSGKQIFALLVKHGRD
jgi:hypothetical protein